jgi:hypothetical protein
MTFVTSATMIALVAIRLSAQAPAGGLTVHVGDKVVALTAAELAGLPRDSALVATDSGTSVLSGVALWDVLQRAGAVSDQASGRQRAVVYLRLTGADGQSAVMALVEVDPSFSRRRVLLADRRNGNPLDAAEGPWRAIIPDEMRHARWIRGVVSISVETLR